MKVTAPSSITVKDVRALQTVLLQALETTDAIEIDLSAVQEADLSLPQLFAALRVSAIETGQEFRLSAPAPSPVVALLERAGFLAEINAADLDFWFHGERPQ